MYIYIYTKGQSKLKDRVLLRKFYCAEVNKFYTQILAPHTYWL